MRMIELGLSFSWTPQTMAFLASTALTIGFGFLLLPELKKHKLRQTVRDDGPQTHLSKMGTPTMGGVIFLIPLIPISAFLVPKYPDIPALLLVTLAFGLIGFTDDMLKVRKRSKDGLFAKQKLLLEILAAAGFTFYMAVFSEAGTGMILPFSGMQRTVDLPLWFYIPFIIFVLTSVTNAVNLTDGVDGLAAGVTLAYLFSLRQLPCF